MSTLNRILTARRFAIAAHAGQTYGPDLPYEYHLDKVQQVGRHRITEEMLEWAGVTQEQFEIALWLHDAEEDTPVTYAMIEAIWGPKVADMVHAVTDVEGHNRNARKWGTPENPGPMYKLRSNRGGILVKLCDRIANVEACLAAAEKLPPNKRRKGTMLGKYREEQSDLRALRETSPAGPVWDHLEALLRQEP